MSPFRLTGRTKWGTHDEHHDIVSLDHRVFRLDRVFVQLLAEMSRSIGFLL
jgi:hypothetical protein